MRAEKSVRPQFAAFAERDQCGFVELRSEREGIGVQPLAAIVPAHFEAIVEMLATQRHARFEETVAVMQQVGQRFAADGVDQFDRCGAWQQRAHPQFSVGIRVQTKHRERIGVPRRQQCIDVPLTHHGQPRGPLMSGAVRTWPAQILSVYSRTVRSVEKKPMPAILRSAQAFHASRSRYSASTRAWVAT